MKPTVSLIFAVTSVLAFSDAPAYQLDMSHSGSDPTVRDSCSEISRAIALLPPEGGGIHLSGRFRSSCALKIENKSISLRGDGPGVSQLIFTSDVKGRAGIFISENNPAAGVTIDGISIYTSVDQSEGNAAVSVRYAAPSSIQKGPRFSNLDIRGEEDRSYWARGIDCEHCIAGTADDLTISGKNTLAQDSAQITSYMSLLANDGAKTANMDRAISLDFGSNDFKIRALHAYLSNFGVFIDNGSEGVGLSESVVIATNWGIYNGPGQIGTPSQFVSQSHFNTIIGGIYSAGCLQRQYGPGNLFYKWTSSQHDWIGIDASDGLDSGKVVGCTQTQIFGNIFYGFRGRVGMRGNSTGVRFGRSADWNDISNNNSTLIDVFLDRASGHGNHNLLGANSYQLVGEAVRP